jgi:hypothetical protein
MITADKMNTDLTTYSLMMVLLFIVLGFYGRPVIEWFLLKLYEFFIQQFPMKL